LRTALILACVSFVFIFLPYIGWFLDLVIGPAAFATSAAAIVQGVRRRADRVAAIAVLMLTLPAFAWACFALFGGMTGF
jgi:hypothetical protein